MYNLQSVTGLASTFSVSVSNLFAPITRVSIRFSYLMNHLYDMSGIEKLVKVALPITKIFERCVFKDGTLNLTIKALGEQKSLIYATKVVNSINKFIAPIKDKDNNDTGQFKFHLPTSDEILYFFADGCDTLKFLKTVAGVPFETFSRVAEQLGGLPIYGSIKFIHIPILNTLCETPKDFFVFFASLIKAGKGLGKIYGKFNDGKAWGWEKKTEVFIALCKFVDSIGKMSLITFGPYYGRYLSFLALDLITQGSGFIAFLAEKELQRQRHFVKAGITLSNNTRNQVAIAAQ